MIKTFCEDLKKEFKGYSKADLAKDLMAGLTVAAVALPLALAFGVSSGADASAGLITAIIAGLVIGTLSGASYQISGPTGAMSAILLGIAAKFGISGVLTAGLLSGVILLIAALVKTGKLVSYIPTAVITGFTSGIAIIIALGQLNNFFGVDSEGASTIAKAVNIFANGFSPNILAMCYGLAAVLIMALYPKKLAKFIPGSLASIIIVLIANVIMNPETPVVSEVGAIPTSLISDKAIFKTGLDLSNVSSLNAPAFSIAVLGMIESLLCGASAGKMKGEKMNSQRELVAQGIGNILIPIFGGVPATAAIARTSVAIKSGGKTRLVSVFHSLTLILSMFLLGGAMSRIPLSALAGVLIVTAWRMNEWHEIKRIFKGKHRSAILQFLVTAASTVVFDLTVAILIGVLLSMFIFVIKSCNLSVIISDVDNSRLEKYGIKSTHSHTKLIYLSGPMFFGTQATLSNAVATMFDYDTVIMSMRGVPSIDMSAITELEELYDEFTENGIRLLFCGVQPEVKVMLDRFGFSEAVGEDSFFWDAVEALSYLEATKASK